MFFKSLICRKSLRWIPSLLIGCLVMAARDGRAAIIIIGPITNAVTGLVNTNSIRVQPLNPQGFSGYPINANGVWQTTGWPGTFTQTQCLAGIQLSPGPYVASDLPFGDLTYQNLQGYLGFWQVFNSPVGPSTNVYYSTSPGVLCAGPGFISFGPGVLGITSSNGTVRVTTGATNNGIGFVDLSVAVPYIGITNGQTNITLQGTFSGSGSNLFNLTNSPDGLATTNYVNASTNTLLGQAVAVATNGFGNIVFSNASSFVTTGQGTSISNGAIASAGIAATNYGNQIGFAATNYANQLGVSVTNYASNLSTNATNFTLSIGQVITNFVYTVALQSATNQSQVVTQGFYQTLTNATTNVLVQASINATNIANTLSQNVSNYVLLQGVNSTNQSLLIGQNGTNYVLVQGVNWTNEALLAAQQATNGISFVITNTLVQTNDQRVVSLPNGYVYQATNFTGSNGLLLAASNISFSIGAAATNQVNVASNAIQSQINPLANTNYPNVYGQLGISGVGLGTASNIYQFSASTQTVIVTATNQSFSTLTNVAPAFVGDGSRITNINGVNIQTNTVTSNQIALATVTTNNFAASTMTFIQNIPFTSVNTNTLAQTNDQRGITLPNAYVLQATNVPTGGTLGVINGVNLTNLTAANLTGPFNPPILTNHESAPVVFNGNATVTGTFVSSGGGFFDQGFTIIGYQALNLMDVFQTNSSAEVFWIDSAGVIHGNGNSITNIQGSAIVSGVNTATNVVSGGSLGVINAVNLTNIPAANITGTETNNSTGATATATNLVAGGSIGAVNGSALTNLTAGSIVGQLTNSTTGNASTATLATNVVAGITLTNFSQYVNNSFITVLQAGNSGMNGQYVSAGTNLGTQFPTGAGATNVTVWTNTANNHYQICNDPTLAYFANAWSVGWYLDLVNSPSSAAYYNTLGPGYYFNQGVATIQPATNPSPVIYYGTNFVSSLTAGIVAATNHYGRFYGDGSGLFGVTATTLAPSAVAAALVRYPGDWYFNFDGSKYYAARGDGAYIVTNVDFAALANGIVSSNTLLQHSWILGSCPTVAASGNLTPYVCSNLIVITNTSLVVKGDDRAAVEIQAAPNSAGIFVVSNTFAQQRGGFYGLYLNGQLAATNAIGIDVAQGLRPIIENCELRGFQGEGIHISGQFLQEATVYNCNIIGSTQPWNTNLAACVVVDVTNSPGARTLIIADKFAITGRGVYVTNDAFNVNIVASSFACAATVALSNSSPGIEIAQGQHIQISDCDFLGFTNSSVVSFDARSVGTNVDAFLWGNQVKSGNGTTYQDATVSSVWGQIIGVGTESLTNLNAVAATNFYGSGQFTTPSIFNGYGKSNLIIFTNGTYVGLTGGNSNDMIVLFSNNLTTAFTRLKHTGNGGTEGMEIIFWPDHGGGNDPELVLDSIGSISLKPDISATFGNPYQGTRMVQVGAQEQRTGLYLNSDHFVNSTSSNPTNALGWSQILMFQAECWSNQDNYVNPAFWFTLTDTNGNGAIRLFDNVSPTSGSPPISSPYTNWGFYGSQPRAQFRVGNTNVGFDVFGTANITNLSGFDNNTYLLIDTNIVAANGWAANSPEIGIPSTANRMVFSNSQIYMLDSSGNRGVRIAGEDIDMGESTFTANLNIWYGGVNTGNNIASIGAYGNSINLGGLVARGTKADLAGGVAPARPTAQNNYTLESDGYFWSSNSIFQGPTNAVSPQGVAGWGYVGPAIMTTNFGSGNYLCITNGNITNSGGVFAGNGAALTNLVSAFSIVAPAGTTPYTNWILGAAQTNSSGRMMYVSVDAALTVAAVSGQTDMKLWVTNGTSGFVKTVSLATSASTVADVITNGLSAYIPTGYGFWFTNLSAGAGNSSAVVPASGQLVQY